MTQHRMSPTDARIVDALRRMTGRPRKPGTHRTVGRLEAALALVVKP